MENPRYTVGGMLVGIAALHLAVAVLGGLGFDPTLPVSEPPFPAMLRDGLIASVGVDPWRLAITWYTLCGLVLMQLGLLSRQSELAGVPPARWFARSLLALSVLGSLLMPASGCWLLFVPAWRALRASAPSSLAVACEPVSAKE
ncbi:MAG: DUF6463 family protein [Polyangiales bacterium]